MSQVFENIKKYQNEGKKSLAILLDPDDMDFTSLKEKVKLANEAAIDFLFVGGSLITQDCLDQTLDIIKSESTIPVVIFPGSAQQINKKADAILLLSLISGRNPEMLIGAHVAAAPALKASGLEIIATGYLLIDSGKPTTASYVSNTLPLPHNKPSIAAATALAGEQLGLKLTFLDGGSGAENPVSPTMVKSVRKLVSSPIVVGGGVSSPKIAKELFDAGADLIVIGTAIEENPQVIKAFAEVRG